MTDVSLNSLWSSWGQYSKDDEVKEAVMYMNNLPFSKFLDPCKNVKFPGQMVVSVGRRNLPLFKGHDMVHVPYKRQEIQAWFHPRERGMPNVQFNHRESLQINRSSFIPSMLPTKKNYPMTEDLDFGSEDGLFYMEMPMMLNSNDLDFGGENGLFTISMPISGD